MFVAYISCQSFHTQVISYLLWSFRTYFLAISYPVITILYPGHFVPILVISYLGQLGMKWLYGGQFIPKSLRTRFGHFVPILVVWYLAKMDGWMDGWIDERAGGQAGFELQLNKANTSDTEAPFLDLHLSISNGFVSSKI